MLHLRLAIFLLLAHLAPLFQAATYKVDNLSPSIVYDPPLCGERFINFVKPQWHENFARNAWTSIYSDVRNIPHELQRLQGHHYTRAAFQSDLPAPSASLSFVGSWVAVVGPPDGSKPYAYADGTIQLEIDGVVLGSCTEVFENDQLNCNRTVGWGRHNLTVRVIAGGFALDHFEVGTGKDEEQSPVQVPLTSEDGGLNNDGTYAFTPIGQWSRESGPIYPKLNRQANWTRAMTSSFQASLSIAVPRGNSRISMFGAVDIDHGPFKITLTPPSYGLVSFLGNAWNSYFVRNFSIFDTVLDPEAAYTLNVTNLAPDGAYMEISHFQLYQAKSDSSKSASSGGMSRGMGRGAIAGIVVGCSVGVALAGVLGWMFHRRRHKQGDQIDIESEHGDVIDHRIEPYRDDRPASEQGGAVTGPMAAVDPGPVATQSSSPSSPPASSSKDSSTTPLKVQNPDTNALTMGMPSTAKAGPSVIVQHVHHTDGGALKETQPQAQASQALVVVEESPPTYNSDWAGPSLSSGGAAGAAEMAQSEKSALALVASASWGVLGPTSASVDASVPGLSGFGESELSGAGRHEKS